MPITAGRIIAIAIGATTGNEKSPEHLSGLFADGLEDYVQKEGRANPLQALPSVVA